MPSQSSSRWLHTSALGTHTLGGAEPLPLLARCVSQLKHSPKYAVLVERRHKFMGTELAGALSLMSKSTVPLRSFGSLGALLGSTLPSPGGISMVVWQSVSSAQVRQLTQAGLAADSSLVAV